MRNLVEHILNKEYDTANQIFESEIETVTRIKLNEAKKMVAARMAEQVPAFMGAAGGNAVKLRRGVLEEDDLDEMDLSREKPDYDSIEDRRKGQIVQDANKTSLPKKEKSDNVTVVQKNNMKEQQVTYPDFLKKAQDYVDKSDAERKRNNDGKLDPDEQEFANKITGRNDEIVYPNKPLYPKTNMKEETEELDEARIKILKARVRGGKVQRRRKVSNVEGHKIVDGKLKRMSPAERRRRKLGQKRGKLKRRSKMRQALMKRRRSLKRRAAIGL